MTRRTTPRSRLLSPLRALAWAVPLALGSFVLAQTAAGQESPSPSAIASPGPTGSPAPADSAGPGATTAASPRLDPLPLESDPVLPSSLPNPIPAPTPIRHPGDGTQNSCVECHTAVNDKQHGISTEWSGSIHATVKVGCADCHGGDPTSASVSTAMSKSAGFIGVPDRMQIVGISASCHSDPALRRPYGIPPHMFDKDQTSVHGLRLFTESDTRVAICTDCHGVHDIKKASDPTSPVFPLNVPKLCASCHSDATLMAPYGIPTDQLATYSQSVHGLTLIGKQDVRAPNCASCHGSHGAKPPQSTEVVEVCGKCHTATLELFQQSRHATLEDAAPKCVTCHGAHDVVRPDESRFFHLEPPTYQCLTCHDPVDRTLKLQSTRFSADADRRCDTCHHPDSLISSQIQAIHDSVDGAATAFDDAQQTIDQAASLGMLVQDAEVQLAEAKTSLIRARATVHTTNLATVNALSADSIKSSNTAKGLADAKIQESEFRRTAMVVIVGFIVVDVFALYLWKRRLDRQLGEGE